MSNVKAPGLTTHEETCAHTNTHKHMLPTGDSHIQIYRGGGGGVAVCPMYSHTLLICSQQETPTSKCTGGWLSVPCTPTHYSYAPNRRLPHPNVQGGGWLSLVLPHTTHMLPTGDSHIQMYRGVAVCPLYSHTLLICSQQETPTSKCTGGGGGGCLSLVLPHTTHMLQTGDSHIQMYRGGGCLSLVLPHTTYLATTRNCSTLLSGKRLGSQT